MDRILMPTEIEFYIETMVPQDIHNVGTKQWIEWHQRLQKLHQEALLEASQLKDEHVKETLVDFEKASILVHEAILINTWKSKILPQILKLEPAPTNTFLAYTVLYHEAVCVALLELVLYHSSCCEILQDSAADLLSYAYTCASQLISVKYTDAPKQENSKAELLRQMSNLGFEMGIRCLSIIRYLAESLGSLSLSVCSNFYDALDIPVLFVHLLENRPWIDNNKQFSNGKFMEWDGESVGQVEAQVWLCLRQLLLDPACKTYYSVTDARRTKITKLMMLLTPTIMDQISPLIELKQWLSYISMTDQPVINTKPILVETVLEINERILRQTGGKWKKIAREQLGVIFSSDHKTLVETAQTLSDAFNTDFLEKVEITEKAKCKNCDKSAIQRCSHCKKVWYCSRACQVANWAQHKESCSA